MLKTRVMHVAAALAAAFALAGCAGDIGPTQTFPVNVPRPADPSEVWTVELNLGAASVQVGSSGEGIVQGTIAYNVESLKPTLTIAPGRVTLGQEFKGVLPVNTRNDWRLQLGRGVRTRLVVNTGASSGTWELGGLWLEGLTWAQGAADATVSFGAPNPAALSDFSVRGGAASLTMRGLGSANIRSGGITAGAGVMTLVFDGQLAADTTLMLDGGVSSVVIYSGGNPVQLIDEGALKAIEANDWAQLDDTYTSPEWATASGPRITLRSRLGVATLRLITGR